MEVNKDVRRQNGGQRKDKVEEIKAGEEKFKGLYTKITQYGHDKDVSTPPNQPQSL